MWGSGAKDAFIECGLFGPKSVEIVIASTAVARSRTMFHEDVKSAFEIYHRQVYMDKEVHLLDRITKMVLNPIDYLPSEKLDNSDSARVNSLKNIRDLL